MENEYVSWRLILRKIAGENLSEAEERQLQDWMKVDVRRREYVENARKDWLEPGEENIPDLPRLMDRFDRFTAQATPGKPGEHKRSFVRLKVFLPYAAAVLIPLCLIMMMVRFNREEPQPVLAAKHTPEVILPGSSQASIVLSDGQRLVLDGKVDSLLCVQEGLTIRQQAGTISYQARKDVQEERFNLIDIPRGGEYCLELSDGTRVWLNSSSKLRYPENFVREERVVELSGEAYFEVAKNDRKPFIVKTGQQDIRVYGTAFNVYAYPGEKIQHTTLKEGRVSVSRKGREYFLQPGQQARIDTLSPGIVIEKVRPEQYCSWLTGKIPLENERLEDILLRLARWYNVDFVFNDDQLKDLHFSGDLERYADFSEILRLIQMTTSVEFVIQGRQVIVQPLE